MDAVVFDRNAIDATNIVDYIADVFERRGAESYLGEKVSMAQHMLQAAAEAESSQADPAGHTRRQSCRRSRCQNAGC